jgi:hypothetical protein
MSKFLVAAGLALGLSIGMAGKAEAISISLDACKAGQDCTDLTGSIDTNIDLVGGQLEFVIDNNIVDDQVGEASFIDQIGFVYDGDLTGLTLDSFVVDEGVVATPTLSFDGKVTNLLVDFDFDFQQENTDGRFQPGDKVTILVDFTGTVTLDNFLSGAAHLQGVGENAENSLGLVDSPDDVDVDIPDDLDIVDIPDDLDVEPEPATLMLFGAGMAVAGARMRRRNRK